MLEITGEGTDISAARSHNATVAITSSIQVPLYHTAPPLKQHTSVCCCDLSQGCSILTCGDGGCIHQAEKDRDGEIRGFTAVLAVSNEDKRCDAAGCVLFTYTNTQF